MGLLDWFSPAPTIGGGSIRGGYGPGLLGGADIASVMNPQQAKLLALQQGLAGFSQGIMRGRGLGQGLVGGLLGASGGVADARKQTMDEGLLGLKVQDYLDQRKERTQQAENEAKRQAALDHLTSTVPKAWVDKGGLPEQWADYVNTAGPDKAAQWMSPQDLSPVKASEGDVWVDPVTHQVVAKIPKTYAPQQGSGPSEFERLAAAAGLKPGSPEYIAAATKKLGGGDSGGPYGGTSMDAQDMNVLLDPQADTSSPLYAQAFARQYEQPKYQSAQIQQSDGTIQTVLVPVKPVVPQGIRKPTQVAAAAAQQAAPAQQPTDLPAPAQQPADTAAVAQAQQPAPQDSQIGQPVVIGSKDPNAVTPVQMNEYKKKSLQLDNLKSSLDQYKTLIKDIGPSLAGGVGISTADNTKLSSAYTSLLIEMKNLFELGALSGPDYGLMQQSIQDPNTLKGAWLGSEGLENQMSVVYDKLKTARANLEQQYGQEKKVKWKFDDKGNLVKDE